MLSEILISPYFWIFVATFVLFYVVKQIVDVKTGKCLPGPWGLPYIGYLPFVSKYIHEDFAKLAKTYGPVFQIRLGTVTAVILNDTDSIRDCLKLPVTSGRVDTPMILAIREVGESSLIFRHGDASWKLIRKTTVRALALFSTSRNSRLEHIVHSAVEHLREKLRQEEGKPIGTNGVVLRCLSFGREPDPDDPLLHTIFKFAAQIGEATGKIGVAEFLPILAIFYRKIWAEMLVGMKQFVGYVTEKIHEHEYHGEIRTIADGLKKAIEEADEKELASVGLTKSDILMALLDLFDGGFFTTAENTMWIMLLLATNPEVQKKVHQEIDHVVGRDRLPSVNDQDRMPYITACIFEELRFTSNVPLALPHCAMDDFEFRGYLIPKGTAIMPNIWAVHHDPRVFPDPEKFDPSRFLTEEGKISPEEIAKPATFSAGPRRCPGENLAKQELFILNASVLQEFEVHLDPQTEGNPLKPKPGMTLSPGPHQLIFKRRA